jgi:hypothetical protein
MNCRDELHNEMGCFGSGEFPTPGFGREREKLAITGDLLTEKKLIFSE